MKYLESDVMLYNAVYISFQVLVLVRFVCDFISNNPFLVCSEELSFIRKELHREGDELKVRQRAGSVLYRAYQGRWV